MELGGTGPREEPVPGLRADPSDERQLSGGRPEPDRSHEPGKIGEQVAHGLFCPPWIVATRNIADAVSRLSTA
jgi:hypothetical protein